ncbi:MAG TPA: GNAT family N-acetyltransferase [Bacteroidota bacterium]|nr:GNAT family N-acetyltransferase [Bacteroidota bacterium]
MIRILEPVTNEELDRVRDLFRSFVSWHRDVHEDDRHLIDRYFDAGKFEEELAVLPGPYASPDGRLLLALWNGEAAGAVALRRIDDRTCEMKRMFVYQRFHGKGIGRALGEAILREARLLGYSSMRLDTSFRQVQAQALYRSLGFRTIDPYYELPQELREWLVFMELKL